MGWQSSGRTRAAGFAVGVFGLSALVGCSGGSTEVTASEEPVAGAPAGDVASAERHRAAIPRGDGEVVRG